MKKAGLKTGLYRGFSTPCLAVASRAHNVIAASIPSLSANSRNDDGEWRT
jgi:hypothetical protein